MWVCGGVGVVCVGWDVCGVRLFVCFVCGVGVGVCVYECDLVCLFCFVLCTRRPKMPNRVGLPPLW